MMGTSMGSRYGPRLFLLSAATLLVVGAPLSAQNPAPRDPPATDQPDGDGVRPRPSDRRAVNLADPETRKKVRDNLAKRLENLKQALALVDQGKSWDEVRAVVPDLSPPGPRADGPIRRADGPIGGQLGNNSRNPADASRPLTAEDRETAREFLRLTAPRILAKVQELEKTKPGEADQQYAETLRRARGFLELRKRDPQMYELRAKEIRNSRQALEFAQAIAQMKSPDPDSEDYQAKFGLLRTALMEQHSIRSQIMKRELDRMTRELAERAAHTDENIDEAAHDLIDREKRKHEGKGSSADGKDGPPPHHSGDEPDGHKQRP